MAAMPILTDEPLPPSGEGKQQDDVLLKDGLDVVLQVSAQSSVMAERGIQFAIRCDRMSGWQSNRLFPRTTYAGPATCQVREANILPL